MGGRPAGAAGTLRSPARERVQRVCRTLARRSRLSPCEQLLLHFQESEYRFSTLPAVDPRAALQTRSFTAGGFAETLLETVCPYDQLSYFHGILTSRFS